MVFCDVDMCSDYANKRSFCFIDEHFCMYTFDIHTSSSMMVAGDSTKWPKYPLAMSF